MHTLKEAAGILNKSKSALEYQIRKLTDDQKAIFLSVDKQGVRHITDRGMAYFKAVYSVSEPDLEKDKEQDAEAKTEPETDAKSSESTNMVPFESVQAALATVKILSDQISAKDRQIEEKDRQIREKDDQIRSLLEQINRKRSFWSWLTGK